ncbi:16S rRNA (cytidine(1402)-2'-O)-methyltransferase [Acetivibrio mesophilus]|uniref:Ribosomal RNA small subunit methyltransferase I n=1 Tax=Acetivibrio mesophilus TaxID=2487273 RepID=A0A4Q0I5Y1_9FIRM|nr:16S rRNA (cytidine(1402)-2'-O)-methyltransferase [Acetivibrio mesophilus]RXE59297.1 16S rRNA (cytidine(1402)-2'-O)-methyltransferase [Acetivibrio mesophilus]HHV28371.1 16S rRNA (cytidine(1402)-2'-O)-methyltransferase [Clostridium sp.]
MSNKGILYLVATPIGNLEDITLRAIRVLKEVDLIAAEDTRQTIKLLNHLDIKKPMVSYYEHNKVVKGNYLIEQLQEGKSIALVSDAGTPGISDPGEDMVKLCIENEIPFTMVPGPVAAVTGLVLSGLPSGRFAFEGFLPMNKRARRERINSLKDEIRTIVFYEAPHKLVYTLKDLYEVLGNRRITLARELTKKFEEILRCTLEEAMERYESEAPRGEYVLIVEGADEKQIMEDKKSEWNVMSIAEHYQMYIEQGLPKKEAMKKVAQDREISKRDVYNALI